jgi:hypothetical protein
MVSNHYHAVSFNNPVDKNKLFYETAFYYVILESLPQFIIQNFNNFILGYNLNWITVLSPMLSFLSLVKAVQMYVIMQYTQKAENTPEYQKYLGAVKAAEEKAFCGEVSIGTFLSKWSIRTLAVIGYICLYFAVIWQSIVLTQKYTIKDIPSWVYDNYPNI